MQLWDVCSDQEAVDLVRHIQDPQVASKTLVDHALARFSTDNLSCMIVRFDNKALKQRRAEHQIGVDGDIASNKGGISEADAIVAQTKKQLESGEVGAQRETADNMIVEEEEVEGGTEMEVDAAESQAEKKS
jgi:protein phosphatase PTC1